MGKPRPFTTMPANAMADSRLSALQLRVLMVIGLHDGRSLAKGKGGGCYARSSTMAATVRTDITNFSKAVSVLIKLGYVVRERQQSDSRRFTLRVVEPADDSWRDDQLSSPDKLGEATNDRLEIVVGPANFSAEIVGESDDENGSISKEIAAQKTSLREELDFDESKEINSSEEAHFAVGEKRPDDFSTLDNGFPKIRKNGAEAPAIRMSLDREIRCETDTFSRLGPDAQLSIFERAFAKIGRDTSGLPHEERLRWGNWLLEMFDDFQGQAIGHRADRLLGEWENSQPAMPVEELRQWARQIIRTGLCGTQGHLAEAAGIPAPTLSQFKNGKNLPERFHEGLQAACEGFLPYTEWVAAA